MEIRDQSPKSTRVCDADGCGFFFGFFFLVEPRMALDGRAGISAAGAHLLHGGQSPYGATLLGHIWTVPLAASDLFKTVISVPAEVFPVYIGG